MKTNNIYFFYNLQTIESLCLIRRKTKYNSTPIIFMLNNVKTFHLIISEQYFSTPVAFLSSVSPTVSTFPKFVALITLIMAKTSQFAIK